MTPSPVEEFGESNKSFFIALGQFVYWFGFAETIMKWFIDALTNPQEPRIVSNITADAPFKPLHASLMSLYRIRQPDLGLVAHMESVLNRIKTAEEKQRNLFVHKAWDIINSKEQNVAFLLKETAKFGEGFKSNFVPYSIDQINSDTEKLYHCIIELWLMFRDWYRYIEKGQENEKREIETKTQT